MKRLYSGNGAKKTLRLSDLAVNNLNLMILIS
jgi:hypothetical protein